MGVLRHVPFGAVVFAVCTLVAIVPARRPRSAAVASWVVAMVPSEVPGFFLAIVVVSNVAPLVGGELTTTRDRAAFVLSALTAIGLVALAIRSSRTGAVTRAALDSGLPRGWRHAIVGRPAEGDRSRRPLIWQLVVPWPRRPRRVERHSDITYGPHGPSNRLDVYRRRDQRGPSPTLVHLHGGRFRWGSKSREARPLLHRLADHGWVCISADYRLARSPGNDFPDALVDAKRIVAWCRGEEGRTFGVDPTSILVAGSSAGAHLAAMVALTPGDRSLQPGFGDVDTSVAAAIGFYGYYGRLGGPHDAVSSPAEQVVADAPPFFVAHGTNDTYTPLAGAREMVRALRSTSRAPVVYAELPGAQHSFDLFPSLRYEKVVDAVEQFGEWVCAPARRGTGPS